LIHGDRSWQKLRSIWNGRPTWVRHNHGSKQFMNATSMPSPHANCPTFSLVRMRQEVMRQQESPEHPAVRTARTYMEAHFAEDISIAKLAALVSLSPLSFRACIWETYCCPSPRVPRAHSYREGAGVPRARPHAGFSRHSRRICGSKSSDPPLQTIPWNHTR
jgi:hypothetical protein